VGEQDQGADPEDPDEYRAQLRVMVKRILRKYGYPPDEQEKATQTVLEQAALLSEEWATA
jgi:type I restriction enzyme R subunit